jgi:ABC-type cobalamin/Fe3+-siderophores transport system ATPase subunit
MSIFNHFKHLNLSQGQETALTKLEAFLASPVQVFMLKGYAGSGKTTILKGLVEYLNAVEKDYTAVRDVRLCVSRITDNCGSLNHFAHLNKLNI